jgi:hypothetical protein
VIVRFEAIAGTAITYTVTQFGDAQQQAYLLYHMLERLD